MLVDLDAYAGRDVRQVVRGEFLLEHPCRYSGRRRIKTLSTLRITSSDLLTQTEAGQSIIRWSVDATSMPYVRHLYKAEGSAGKARRCRLSQSPHSLRSF